jgi:DNA-directed RNA polymerase subunit K/omega
MVKRPSAMSAYEFAVVSGLRAKQLMRGCIPMVGTSQKMIMTAQLEVAAGLVAKVPDPPAPTEI